MFYGTSDLILQEKKVGELRYSTVNIDKYGELPPIDLSLLWPTHELEVPLTTPPKGRPQTQTQTLTLNTTQQQKRQHSSPETLPNTSVTTTKSKRHKKSKKKINAESSISDHNNSSDDEIPEVARIHEMITGKRSYTKKNINNKLASVTRNTL